jgi:hypothetical protein
VFPGVSGGKEFMNSKIKQQQTSTDRWVKQTHRPAYEEQKNCEESRELFHTYVTAADNNPINFEMILTRFESLKHQEFNNAERRLWDGAEEIRKLEASGVHRRDRDRGKSSEQILNAQAVRGPNRQGDSQVSKLANRSRAVGGKLDHLRLKTEQWNEKMISMKVFVFF